MSDIDSINNPVTRIFVYRITKAVLPNTVLVIYYVNFTLTCVFITVEQCRFLLYGLSGITVYILVRWLPQS